MLRQNNRWEIRLSFAAVLLMGLIGFWYAVSVWMPMLDAVDLSAFADNVDWVDTAATIGEQVVELLLGSVSYTHLDVYKRQASRCTARHVRARRACPPRNSPPRR